MTSGSKSQSPNFIASNTDFGTARSFHSARVDLKMPASLSCATGNDDAAWTNRLFHASSSPTPEYSDSDGKVKQLFKKVSIRRKYGNSSGSTYQHTVIYRRSVVIWTE